MAATKLDIWNTALGRIGETQPIEDEGVRSAAGEACRLHYDRCRREVLKALWWPFATFQAVLTSLPVTRVGWEFTYALPVDLLEARVLLGEGQRWDLTTPDTRTPFAIQANDAGDGVVLCCDLESGSDFEVLEYTRDIESVGAFDPLFESALAWRLAAELTLALKKGQAEWEAIMDPRFMGGRGGRYPQALELAYAAALRGSQPDPQPDTPSISARL